MSELLQKVMERARKSPFYEGRLTEGQAFADAPITTKADLRCGYPFGFLAVEKSRVLTYHESSGTEGNPISSYFSPNDWKDISSRFVRNAIGLSANDTILIKTPYSMVTTAHQAQKAAESVGALVIPADNRSANMPYSRVVQLIRDLSVTVTWSLPHEVLLWGIAARKNGLDPKTDFPNLRAFWVAGEPLSESKKALLSSLWGGKAIFEDYGSTETGSLAGECAVGALHAWSDRVHFEVYDSKTEKISEFGRGQLLVTPLYREAMPLIRYLIEDEVVLNEERCACGSSMTQIQVSGRESSRIEIQEKKLLPKDIEEQVFHAGLPFGISLWKAHYDSNTLVVDYFSEDSNEKCARSIEKHLKKHLGVESVAVLKPLKSFISATLFTEGLSYSKPNYLTRRSI